MLWDFQWQADRICSKETPDWKALEAAKALISWALSWCSVGLLVRELITKDHNLLDPWGDGGRWDVVIKTFLEGDKDQFLVLPKIWGPVQVISSPLGGTASPVAWTRLGPVGSGDSANLLVLAPGWKNGFWLVMTSAGFTTGSTGTAKDLDNSIASSLANLSAHLSSRFFKSSDEGLLLVLGFLLDLGWIASLLLLSSRHGFRLNNSLLSLYFTQNTDVWRVHESGGRGGRNHFIVFVLSFSVGGGG